MTRIHVTNHLDWTKVFTLTNKRIIHIGSDAKSSDVHLDGVAGRQASLIEIRARNTPLIFGLTNLGTDPIEIHTADRSSSSGETNSQKVLPGGYAQLRCGDAVLISGYRLVAEDDAGGGSLNSGGITSGKVGAGANCANGIASDVMQIVDFRLSGSVLRLDTPIDGILTIRNTGDKDNVNFKIELMPKPYCTLLDSIVPLAIGEQQPVRFKIQQARETPWREGERLIEVKVTAPSYRPKFTSHSCAIQVSPFYQHSVELSEVLS